MKRKEVRHLIPAEDINMGGIIVKQALPTQRVPNVDPYLLLHHADFTFRNDTPARHQGIGPHPHRGFSPVTFVVEGEVHHRDSRGNNQVAKAGEVQWMHAGSGIIHSERPSQSLVDSGDKQELIQLWINSPAQNKMNPPLYQYLPQEKMGHFTSDDKSVDHYVVAGKINDYSSPIQMQSPLVIEWVKSSKEGRTSHSINEDYSTMLYVIRGSIKIRGYGPVEEKSLIIFGEEGENIEVEILENAQYLLLTGKPINEEIVQSGPYVMNTQTEILQAMRDFHIGKMGILIED